MDDSNTIIIALKYSFLILGTLCLPQVLGTMSIGWSLRRKKKAFIVPALLVAPACFFLEAYAFWDMQAKAIKAEGHYVCGAFGAASAFSTIWGTVVHFCLSFVVLTFYWLIAKRRSRGPSENK